ncbi:MAG TPA: TonB family protein [Terriglobales bacterium]|jgi:protein TonB|nr:TonB family protein [Terriglobales bacterium]
MFAGLENVQANPRRGWTALVSFTLQAAAVAAALAIPLMYPNSLPDSFAHRRIFVPISSPEINRSEPTQQQENSGGSLNAPHNNAILVTNNGFHFPRPGPEAAINEAPSLVLTGKAPNVLAGAPIGTVPLPARPAVEAPPRISRAMQGYLIRRVEPRYPDIARAIRLEGAVLIKAVISTEGNIEQAQVISGSPLLSKAALDAIRQWRYRPYLLNDKPVEVETEITVNFALTR